MENLTLENPVLKNIDLVDLMSYLYRRIVAIVLSFFAGAVLVGGISIFSPNLYVSTALLAPREGSGSLGNISAQYSGIASLAGINLGNESQSSTVYAVETLKSRRFFGDFLYGDILIDLMAVKHWDRDKNEAVIDESIYDVVKEKWVRSVGTEFKVKPSIQEAHSVFIEDFFDVTIIEDTGFVRIKVKHRSPEVAKDWATLIMESINEAMRERDVSEAKSSIVFLEEQQKKTNLVSLVDVFASLIEEQIKTVMLANASKEYTFRIIDPPVTAELPSEPNRVLLSLIGAFLLSFSLIFVLVIKYLRSI